MKDHLAAGHKDSRGFDAAEWARQGLPLERCRSQEPGAKRPDTTWINVKRDDFIKQHPHATPTEVAAHTAELRAAWKDLAPDGRAIELSSLGVAAQTQADHAGMDGGDIDDIDMHEDGDLFWPGSVAWPVRESVLASTLCPAGAEFFQGGVAKKAQSLREKNRRELVVQDAQDIPDDRTYSHRYSCMELHYGLCASDDAEIYERSRQLAGSMERCLGKQLLRKYLQFEMTTGDEDFAS